MKSNAKGATPPPPELDGCTAMRNKCGCGNTVALKGVYKTGKKYYRSSCETCRRRARKAKKGYCERCLTVPTSTSLLDIDHIDADRSNNDPSNLQTLCKPCHKVKTIENGDYKHREKVQ